MAHVVVSVISAAAAVSEDDGKRNTDSENSEEDDYGLEGTGHIVSFLYGTRETGKQSIFWGMRLFYLFN